MKPGVVPEAHAYVETAVPLPIAEAYVVQQQPLLTLAAPVRAPDLYEPFGQPHPLAPAQRTSIVSTQPVSPEPNSVRTAPDEAPALDKTKFNSRLCGCCEDRNLCIYACMCPCVLYGRMAQVLYPNLSSAASSSPGWWSTLYIMRKCFGSTATLTAALRDQIQELQGTTHQKRCCSNFYTDSTRIRVQTIRGFYDVVVVVVKLISYILLNETHSQALRTQNCSTETAAELFRSSKCIDAVSCRCRAAVDGPLLRRPGVAYDCWSCSGAVHA
eukprot:6842-Heterococcus_DN1.PRE.4